MKFPLREGVISEDDVVGEIGQVVDEKLEGRASESDITIFDSTGFALQDSTTVPLEHEVRWPPGSASRRR